jgi:NAD(P)-dependent dehydrogenase (short-subunit alcohol dehydrogenase family)
MIRAALRGRTAIVTGADPGIGAAASRALSRAGASVVLAAYDGQALTTLAADINAAGGHAIAVPMDVTSPVSARRLVEQTLGAFGRLDAAINHAQTRAVSLTLAYQIPAMRRSGGGHIINLAPSTSTQAAMTELTRAAARDHAGSGIRINAVTVGPHGSTEEVADAVVWLCSDDSSLTTGETWHVPSGHLPRRSHPSCDC